MKNKKLTLTIIGVIGLVLITIALSYAYWLITKTQNQQNIITSACLDIELTNEKNDINLEQQYPISDEDGMKLTPYEFTVTNNCNVALDYQIALEATGTESSALASTSLKVALDDNVDLLSNKETTTTTVAGAYASYILGYGTLKARGNTGSEVTHKVRIWIDKDAPIDERNKTFTSKVTVSVGQGIEVPTLKNSILANAEAGNYLYSTTPNFGVTADGEHGLYSAEDDYGTSYYFRGDTENNYVQFGTEEFITGTEMVPGYVFSYTGVGTDDTTHTISPFATLDECNTYLDDVKDYWDDTNDNPFEFSDIDDECYQSGEIEINVYGEKNIYWRIVRINGDGTIRMIYDGTEKVRNGVEHTATIGFDAYSWFDTAGCVSEVRNYAYGQDEYNMDESEIYAVDKVNIWYEKNLANYSSFLADKIFCNDITVDYDTELYDTFEVRFDGPTYEGWGYGYGPYIRLINNQPNLTCGEGANNYSSNEENGNGILYNPIGLITSDELVMAGNQFRTNNDSNYLNVGVNYWTMSPAVEEADQNGAVILYFDSDGAIQYSMSDMVYGVRPVINLRADVPFTGNGSYDTPYVIKTN